jgi:hypothetical protein
VSAYLLVNRFLINPVTRVTQFLLSRSLKPGVKEADIKTYYLLGVLHMCDGAQHTGCSLLSVTEMLQ